MSKPAKQTINNELDTMHTEDVYSLILFALFQLKQDPQYSTLSELAYILDQDSLVKLLQYFGGVTIKIPTTEELNDILDALIIYKRVNLEGDDFAAVFRQLSVPATKTERVKKTYYDLINVMKDITISRG